MIKVKMPKDKVNLTVFYLDKSHVDYFYINETFFIEEGFERVKYFLDKEGAMYPV